MAQALVRRAAFAGSWYPAAPGVLGESVDRYLARAEPPGAPLGIVAPHAGLVYSGPVAGHAYAAAREADPDVIVLVGPSHYVAFPGAVVPAASAFETPLGAVPVDQAVVERLAAERPLVRVDESIHAREHSLELQLPFLARVLPGRSIVPVLMGRQDRGTVDALTAVLAAALAGRRPLVVASSDLSHYRDRRTATALDRVVLDRLDAFDPDGLMADLERDPHHACGGGPIVVAMRVARALGATAGRVLRYADSGDVTGDTGEVVGYVSAAFGRFVPS